MSKEMFGSRVQAHFNFNKKLQFHTLVASFNYCGHNIKRELITPWPNAMVLLSSILFLL